MGGLGSSWDALNPYHVFGMAPDAATRGTAAPSTPSGGLPPSDGGVLDKGAKPWHPDSGLFWFGAFLLATTAGLVGAHARVHAGPVHASGGIGK